MQGVFTGFATIAVVIGVGALLAHLRIVDLGAQQILSRIAFFVASPALMVITLSRADVHQVLSANLLASIAGVVVTAGIYAALARW
ncbi:MAG: AEC family transporter, partial [Pedococcus sp.]